MALIPISSTHSPLIVFIPSQPTMRANIFSCLSSATKKRTFTVAAATVTPNVESENAEFQPRFRRPDLVVQLRRKGQKWNVQDKTRVALMVAGHFLCFLAPFTFSWEALWVALGLYVVTGLLGITLCYHRCLTHRSFKLPKWLEYFFAYCGVQAFQWDPIDLGGFGTITSSGYLTPIIWSKSVENPIMLGTWRNKLSTSLSRTYLLHPTALRVLLYAVGGMPFVVWGMRDSWSVVLNPYLNQYFRERNQKESAKMEPSANTQNDEQPIPTNNPYPTPKHREIHRRSKPSISGKKTGKKLSHCQFSTTYQCTEISIGAQFACKSIPKRKLFYREGYDDVWREIHNMHHLSEHPNVVRIKRTHDDNVFVHLVMELCGGELFDRGVRLFFAIHVTFLVNSVCHLWEKQPWNTGDLSRNNWFGGLLAFGEGWHDNHHAFKFSARHGQGRL